MDVLRALRDVAPEGFIDSKRPADRDKQAGVKRRSLGGLHPDDELLAKMQELWDKHNKAAYNVLEECVLLG